MISFKKAADLRNYLALSVEKGKKVGFVPTMGALHDGHSSLISTSLGQDPQTVASIFVNPTQFNDPADFEKYPHTIEKDTNMLEYLGCPLLFLPSVNEIYPDGAKLSRHYDLGYLETILEGKYRPGHFQGVCTVMHRLLDIVRPDHLFMGQKDYQQCLVIKRLITLIGLPKTIELIICPTLRASDGLAMSSRNVRLSEKSRKVANTIFQSLSAIKENLRRKDLEALKTEAIRQLDSAGFKVDYVEIAGAESLEKIENWDGKQKLVTLAAAYLGDVRLIDNLLLN